MAKGTKININIFILLQIRKLPLPKNLTIPDILV
jgi:hypothetical protein